jgi:hypothetical protein
MALFPFSRARIGNPDFPLAAVALFERNRDLHHRQQLGRNAPEAFTTPPIFFEKPVWNRPRRVAAPGPLKQCLTLKASRFILCAASWSWPADRSADGRTDGRHPE